MLVLLSAYGFLHFAIKTLSFENTDDAVYTSWVYNPLIGAFVLTAVLGLIATGLLLFRRWRPVTRSVMVGTVAAFAVVSMPIAGHMVSQRRHIAPALLRAVERLPDPPGTTEVGSASLSTDHDALEVLQEPQASRSWRTPSGSKADGCAAVASAVGRDPGWLPSAGGCGYVRSAGLMDIYLEVTIGSAGGNDWVVLASAVPHDQ